MPKAQIPHGPDDKICPLHKAMMNTVCHACPLWIKVRGAHPQGDADLDYWDCSLAWLPILLIENANQIRQGAAATESFRNAVIGEAHARQIGGVGPHGRGNGKAIDG